MWRPFNSTISYLGGKRRLVPEIFKHIPPSDKAPVLADAFMGAGSVSLFAKAKGYQVLANDLAERSYAIGRALIENGTAKLEDDDFLRLFMVKKTDGFTKKHYSGKIFTTQTADFIDQFRAHIKTVDLPAKQYLLKLALMKFCIAVRPFGLFISIHDISLLDAGKIIEAMNKKTNRGRTLKQIKNPLPVLLAIKDQINRGVFDNGLDNQMKKGDVFDFIKRAVADVVYFDPPYSATASYEETYKVLDAIIAGEIIKPQVSDFTKKDALEFQDELYRQSKHIKHWVISMGQTDEKTGITPEELLAVVRKYRPNAEVKTLKHKWVINNSARKKQQENIEYLIYTYTKP